MALLAGAAGLRIARLLAVGLLLLAVLGKISGGLFTSRLLVGGAAAS